MNQEIKYRGQTAYPSDGNAPDGDLALSCNLLHEKGALCPLMPPKPIFNIGPGNKLFLHSAGGHGNYIAYNPATRSVSWIGDRTQGLFNTRRPISFDRDIGMIINIAAVGNIIILSTANNLFYIRFDAAKNTYTYLGTHIPDIRLRFGLKLNFAISEITDKNLKVTEANKTSGSIVTDDEQWEAIISVPYDLSVKEGTLMRNYPDATSDRWVGSDYIPLGINIEPDTEYRFRWDVITGTHLHETVIRIYGTDKNGDRKLLLAVQSERSTSGTIEEKSRFDQEYTDVCYLIYTYAGTTDISSYSTRGHLHIARGVDHSATDPDKVDYTIDYTLESYTAIMGAANKFTAEQTSEKSRFIYPFFARYAVRLYDGSYTYVSPPALMIPNSGYVPAISYSSNHNLGTQMILSAFAADLQYSLERQIPEDWRDLIDGIDIFVSQPLWAYDQGLDYDGTKNLFSFYRTVLSLGFGRPYFDNAPESADYTICHLEDYIRNYGANTIGDSYFIKIAARTEEDIHKSLQTTSTFYRITSLGMADIEKSVGTMTDLQIDKGTLSSLPARVPLVEDTLMYAGFTGGRIYEYNRRLHICGATVILPVPPHPLDCAAYISENEGYSVRTYVYLNTDDGQRIVYSDRTGSLCTSWYFYPDPRAFKAAFVLFDDTGVPIGICEVPLTRHELLNGAFWSAEDITGSLEFKPTDTNPFNRTDPGVPAPSSIYVSEPNCPFTFKSSAAVSVGARRVYAIAAAVSALSQGQFGEHPLYAFTSDGVWALSVSSSGTYTAVQPVTRDCVTNIDSITSIDSSVLFASDRGIMELSGSSSTCLTELIADDYPFDLKQLKGLERIFVEKVSSGPSILSPLPFSTYISRCEMIYDYARRRVYIYNSSADYAYVFSIESGSWGMALLSLSSGVNSYPEALAVDRDGNLVDFGQDASRSVRSMLVTRPLSLELPNVLKTVDRVLQRGFFSRSDLAVVLYASRDNINWHLVWSSRDSCLSGFAGSPYRYFRIAVVSDLTPDHYIFGATVSLTPRLTNKIR